MSEESAAKTPFFLIDDAGKILGALYKIKPEATGPERGQKGIEQVGLTDQGPSLSELPGFIEERRIS